MRKKSHAKSAILGLALGSFLAVGAVSAQDYPTKPIQILVGVSPGGSVDSVARLVAAEMSKDLGQPVVVENRVGASGQIAARNVADSKADGYTLLMTSSSLVVQAAIGKNTTVNLLEDFAPVGMAATSPFFIMAGPQVQASSLGDFLAKTKDSTTPVSYGSSGVGTIIHFAGEYLSLEAGSEFLHVPYQGGSEITVAIMAGDISFGFSTPPFAVPMLESGKGKMLAVTTSERSADFPDVPTVAESGYPGYDVTLVFGFLAPKATPVEVLAKLNTSLNKALNSDFIKAEFKKQLIDPAPNTPEHYWARINSDLKVMTDVVSKSGMK